MGDAAHDEGTPAMAIVITTNLDSLGVRSTLERSQLGMSQTIERLSSGLRINSAKDDPTGLAVATRFGVQVRSVNQAIRNVNAGVSAVQTAESALAESSSILERLREVAVQSANDTSTASDRASLQAEVEELVDELNRIGNSTEFNTNKLLDGSFRAKEITVGIDAGETVSITISDTRATRLGARASVLGSAVGLTQLVTGQVYFNGRDVGPSAGADDTLSTTLVSASAISKAAAINYLGGLTGVTAEVQASVVTSVKAVSAFDLTAGGLFINSIDVGVVNSIQADDLGGVFTAAINAISSATGVTAALDSTAGRITLTAEDGRNLDVDVNSAQVQIWTTQVRTAPLKLTSNDAFIVTGTSSTIIGINSGLFTVGLTDVVAAVNVATQSGANAALATLDAAIDQVSERRGHLGAIQNRLESAASGLQSRAEDLTAAKGRVEDADFAEETALFARHQILQQAGIAMLAQANVSPELLLDLLA